MASNVIAHKRYPGGSRGGLELSWGLTLYRQHFQTIRANRNKVGGQASIWWRVS